MKKRVLFLAYSHWMGGVYYIKNQIVQLLSYKPARRNIKVYLYTTQDIIEEYEELLNNCNVEIICKEQIENSVLIRLSKVINSNLDVEIAYLVGRYRISYIFPYFPESEINKKLFLKKSISWIADFQHVHYPQFFEKKELSDRERKFREIAYGHNKLVMSSQSAYKDFANKYPKCRENVYIIPFCSALDRRIVSQNSVDMVKKKYKIAGNYFMICNQFWVHKNHMIVFKALKEAVKADSTIMLVCTGDLSDYRNKKYIHDIKHYITENRLQDNILLLGIIDKADQIQLLKGAVALIQPSLFEGWGTCVEDAKTLKKRILLSKINVHYEQMNKMCRLFDPNNPDELEDLILKLWSQEKDRVQKSGYSLDNARKYGALFYNMLFSGGE